MSLEKLVSKKEGRVNGFNKKLQVSMGEEMYDRLYDMKKNTGYSVSEIVREFITEGFKQLDELTQ